jgi:phenylalanyl-tRNA synthetase beta chain
MGVKPAETKHICIGATGNAVLPGVHQNPRPYSFFDLKGDIETLLRAFHVNTLVFDSNAAEYYRSGYSARAVIDGETIAQFGQIDPKIASARKIRQEVFVGEVYLDKLYTNELRQPKYEALPRYPAVERDFSFIFEDSIMFDKIRDAVESRDLSELRSFVALEIFRGGSVPPAKYSILLRATFQSNERTLREEEIAKWSADIVRALEKLGGKQRA